MKQPPAIELRQGDCMEYLATLPDNAFDLAIVDPPYGIGAGGKSFINGTSKTEKTYYRKNDWDLTRPSKKYFKELMRVSNNQIIWGGNYFSDFLPAFRCFVVWDKTIHGNSYADCELAYTSFDSVARIFSKNMVYVTKEGRIHPTQKPVALYKWLLKNYAKEGDRILDTHLGSGSIAIACFDMGFDLVGIELDKEYFEAAKARFNAHARQTQLF